jgi:hypothetical protein
MDLQLLATRTLGKTKWFVGNNGPTILMGAGVVGVIATNILTARAAVKSQGIPTEIQTTAEIVNNTEVDQNFTQQDKVKKVGQVYIRGGVMLARIWGPSIVVGGASIACLIVSHKIMLKRNTALMGAYLALETAYKAYRQRVVQEIGEERELELYRNPTISRGIIADETGQVCEIIDFDSDMPSPYARFFDASSVNHSKTAEYNLMFLRSQERAANDRLRAYGFLFLNEVYEALGLERSQQGQFVGWKVDAAEKGTGDGFVTFGLYDIANESGRDFVNLLEHVVLLDFNVDGPIRI